MYWVLEILLEEKKPNKLLSFPKCFNLFVRKDNKVRQKVNGFA